MQTIVAEPFADTYAVATKLIDRAIEMGGSTLKRFSGDDAIVSGFMVGGRALGVVVSGHEDIDVAARWLQALDTSVKLVGSWMDEGIIYLDAVDDIWSFGSAIDLAAERGEKAIYEPATGETFTVANFNINQK